MDLWEENRVIEAFKVAFTSFLRLEEPSHGRLQPQLWAKSQLFTSRLQPCRLRGLVRIFHDTYTQDWTKSFHGLTTQTTILRKCLSVLWSKVSEPPSEAWLSLACLQCTPTQTSSTTDYTPTEVVSTAHLIWRRYSQVTFGESIELGLNSQNLWMMLCSDRKVTSVSL